MKKLNIVLSGNIGFDPIVCVDNKHLKFKKNRDRQKIYELETDKEEVEIKIFKWFEIESKHWLLLYIIYFIVSFFGLFDIKDDRKPYSLKYTSKIKLTNEENELNIKLNSFRPDELAFTWEGDCELEPSETNKYFIDEEVQTRRKKLKKIKKIIKICALAVFAITVVLLLIL